MSKRQRRIKSKPKQDAALPPPVAQRTGMRPVQALALPLAFTLPLFALGWLLPAARQNSTLMWSFWGTGAVLLAWSATLLATALRRGRTFTLESVLRKQHYMQACAQLAVIIYWGSYWEVVYDSAAYIVAQLVFAYAFGALLTWSRRDTYTLGFGPFPIIFSINLFLWFKPDWFYLQFLMVAMGIAAKELIQWNKEGRRSHIFNPSSFPLSVFSMVLILSGTSDLTWGEEIANSQNFPPHIFLLIFLAALPGQFLFGVTSMTMSAVVTTYSLSLLYFAATGSHYFNSNHLPIAVFLGMHLLFNDPSTSPRTELGRLIFGMLYGLSVMALFALLRLADAPAFYDKLLQVPILNLMIQGIDRVARSSALKRFDPAALGASLTPPRRNLAYISVWGAFFVFMQLTTGSQAMLPRADALRHLGRVDEAIAQYRELVRIEPEHYLGNERLGSTLIDTGRFQDAVVPLQHALQLQPDTPEAHYNLGFALFNAGRPQDAVPPLERAVQLNPDLTDAHYNLGVGLIELGRPQDALSPLQRALELQPDDSDTHNHLGIALMRAGRPQDAVPVLRRALQLQPDDSDTHNNLGSALMGVGRFQDALPPLRRAIQLQPDHPEAHFNLARVLATVGQTSEAVREFYEAIRLRPDWPAALRDFAVLRATHGDASVRDPEEAVRLASRAAELTRRRDATTLAALAAAYAADGQFAEATRTAESAEALAADTEPHLVAEIRAHLSLYRAGQPLVNSPNQPSAATPQPTR